MKSLTSLLLLYYILFIPGKGFAQVKSDSILVDGNYRSFYFNNSEFLKAGGSLTFVLHGSGGNGKGMMHRTDQLEQRAKLKTFCWSIQTAIKDIGMNAVKWPAP